MKKLMMVALAVGAAAVMTGCTTTTVKTPEWEAKIANHWFARDVDKLTVNRQADGSYSIALNGYSEDVSEKFPAFTREMWAGLGVIGRIAAATVNPAAAGVPLTAEAADGVNVSQIVKAKSDADVALVKAKNELAIAKLNNEAMQKTMTAFAAAGGNVAKATVTCENGSCTVTDGTVTCQDGVCSDK